MNACTPELRRKANYALFVKDIMPDCSGICTSMAALEAILLCKYCQYLALYSVDARFSCGIIIFTQRFMSAGDSPGAACGRNQIRSTKSEILNKSKSPKLKIQNK